MAMHRGLEPLSERKPRSLRLSCGYGLRSPGFGLWLPCHQVTNFLDLPALGRRQPPYMVLRLCGDLCFW
uniref:Uncharacterized protein n=1 Tax=Kalanchoe fedtschenkoi TaxID=63787 RepID=A0A7N0TF89_KALFE